MKRYYLEKERGLDSLSLNHEIKEKISFLIGSPQDYYFGMRNLVLKCGFNIPRKFEKEQSLHEGTYCPVYIEIDGKRRPLARIVLKEYKNGKNNRNGKDREENKEIINNLIEIVNSSI